MHNVSPKALNISISSIQSAISKEIISCDGFDEGLNKELEIPSTLKKHYKKYIETPIASSIYEED